MTLDSQLPDPFLEKQIKHELAEKIARAYTRPKGEQNLTDLFGKVTSRSPDHQSVLGIRDHIVGLKKTSEQKAYLNQLSSHTLHALAKTLEGIGSVEKQKLKTLFQAAISSASDESKKALQECLWQVLSTSEKETISKKAQSLIKQSSGSRLFSKRTPDVSEVIKRLFASDKESEFFHDVELLLGATDDFAKLQALKSVLQDKAKQGFKQKSIDQLLHHVERELAKSGKKMSLVSRIRVEAIKREFQEIAFEDPEATKAKQKELLAELQSVSRQLDDFLRAYTYSSRAEGPLSVAVYIDDPLEWELYSKHGNLTSDLKQFFKNLWHTATYSSPDSKDRDARTVHFEHTKESVKRDRAYVLETQKEIEVVSKQLSDLGQRRHEAFLNQLDAFDAAVAKMGDEEALLKEHPFQPSAYKGIAELAQAHLSLEREFAKLGAEFSHLKGALTSRQEQFQTLLKDGFFLTTFRQAAMAEIQECLYHLESDQERGNSQLILRNIKKELVAFQAILEDNSLTQEIKILGVLLAAVAAAEKQVGYQGPLSPGDPLKISEARQIRSPQKLWFAGQNSPSVFENRVTIKALSILFPLMQLSASAIQEYQRLQNIPQELQKVQPGKPNSLLDIVIESGEFLKLETWTQEQAKLFSLNLTPAEGELAMALFSPTALSSLSYQSFKVLLDKAPISAHAKLLLTQEYQPGRMSSADHQLLHNEAQAFPPTQQQFAKKLMEYAQKGFPISHEGMQQLVQTRPEVLTMPMQEFQKTVADLGLARGDVRCLELLRNPHYLHSLNVVELRAFADLYQLSDATMQQVSQQQNLRHVAAQFRLMPSEDQAIPTAAANLQIVQESSSGPLPLYYAKQGPTPSSLAKQDLEVVVSGGMNEAEGLQTTEKTQRVVDARMHKPSLAIDNKKLESQRRTFENVKRFVEEKSATPITIRDLTHIMSDEVALESTFEGYDNLQGIRRYRQELERMCQLLYEAPFLDGKQLKELQIMQKLSGQLALAEAFDPGLSYKEHEALFEKQFSNLAVGESLLMPGGWLGSPNVEGHFILYEVIKGNDGKARFRFHNVGAQAEHNGQIRIVHKDRIQFKTMPYAEYEIISDDLLRSEHEGKSSLEWLWFYANNSSDTPLVYEVIERIGKKVNQVADPKEMINTQYGGICTHAGVMAFLGSQWLGNITENRFWFQMRLHALHEYFHGSPDYSQTVLLQNTIQKFSEDIAIYLNGEVISQFEAEYATGLLQECKKLLQQHRVEETASVALQNEKSVTQFPEAKVTLASYSATDISPRPNTYQPLDLSRWQPPSSWRDFQKDFTMLSKKIQDSFHLANYEEVLLDTTLLIRKLAESEKLYDLKSTEVDKKTLQEELSKLLELFYKSVQAQIRQKPYLANQVSSQVYFTTLAINFAMQELLQLDCSIITKSAFEICLAQTGDVFVQDPVWNVLQGKIRESLGTSVLLGRSDERVPDTDPGYEVLLGASRHLGPHGSEFIHGDQSLLAALARYLGREQNRALCEKIDEKIHKLELDTIKDFTITNAIRAAFLLSDKITIGILDPDTGQGVTHFSRFEEKLLPHEYELAKKSWYYLEALSKSALSVLNTHELSLEPQFSLRANCETGRAKDIKWLLHVWPSNPKIHLHDVPSNDPGATLRDSYYREHQKVQGRSYYFTTFDHLQNAQQMIHPSIKSEFYTDSYQLHRHDPNKLPLLSHVEALMKATEAGQVLTAQALRQWQEVFSSRMTQVHKALALAEKSPECLFDRNERHLFQNALLASGLLEEALVKSNTKEELVKRLVNLTESSLEQAQRNKDPESQLYLLSMFRQVAMRLPPSFSAERGKILGQIEKALDVAEKQKAESRQLSVERLQYFKARYGTSPPKDIIVSILANAISYGIQAAQSERLDPKDARLSEEFYALMKLFEGAIKDEVEKDSALLTKAIELATGEKRGVLAWHSPQGYPEYVAKFENRDLAIDIHSGAIRGVQSQIPAQMRAHPSYVAVFSKMSPLTSFKISETAYRIVSGDKEYTLLITQKDDFVILLNTPTQKQLQHIPHGSQREDNALLHSLNGWYDPATKESYYQDPESGQFLYKRSENTISKLDSALKTTSVCLENVASEKSPWHFLHAFEEPYFVTLWVDEKTHQVQQLDLMRMGIRFTRQEVEGKQLFISEQFPGYYWDGTHRLDASRALVLKNIKTGERLELFSGHTMKIRTRGWQAREYNSEYEDPVYFAYRVDEQSQKRLPDSKLMKQSMPEALIHLAETQLWNHDYVGALATLRSIPSIHRFTKSEQERVERLVTSQALSRDKTPYGENIILYATYLQVQNCVVNGCPVQAVKSLAERYQRFIENEARMTLAPLSPFEEMRVLNIVKDHLSESLWAARLAIINEKIKAYPMQIPPEETSFDAEMCPSFEQVQDPLVNTIVDKLPVVVQKTNGVSAQKLDSLMDRLQQLMQHLEKGSQYETAYFSGKIQEIQESYKAFRQELKSFEISDMAEFGRIKATLKQEQESAKGELASLEKAILTLALRNYDDEAQQIRRKVNQEAGIFRPRDLQELIEMMRAKDTEHFRHYNPALTPEEAAELATMLYQYLLLATKSQANDRVITAITALEASKDGAPILREIALAKVIEATGQRRNYNPLFEVDLLVYEYRQNVLIRQRQYEDFKTMSQAIKPSEVAERELVLERIMGYGKTYVISPNIINSLLRQETLAAMMLPKPLFASQVAEVSQFLEKAHGIKSFGLSLDPMTALTPENLGLILNDLEMAVKEKRALWITPEDLFTFSLKALMVIDRWSEHMGPTESVMLVRKLFSFLQNNLHLTVDEATQVFSPLVQYILQLGEQRPFKPEILEGITFLMQSLEEADIVKAIDMPFLNSHASEQLEKKQKSENSYTKERFLQEIKPQLANKVLARLASSEHKAIRSYIAALTIASRQQALDYLLGKPEAEGYWQTLTDPSVKATLNHLRAAIVDVLPTALGEKIFQDFGAIPQAFWDKIDPSLKDIVDVGIAIPWSGANNPNIGSRYLHPIAEIVYTLMHYRNQGVQLPDVKLWLMNLHEAFIQEQRNNPKAPITELKSYKTFQSLVGEASEIDIRHIKEPDFERAKELINAKPERVSKFCQEHILLRVKQSTKVAKLGPQFIDLVTKKLQGFTGTLAGSEIFPQAISTEYDPSVYVKTVAALGLKETPVTALGIPSFQSIKSAKEKVDLFYSRPNAYEDLLDLAGAFAGALNEEVADCMLQHARWKDRVPPLLGVVFYDRDDTLKIRVKTKENRIETQDFDPARPHISKDNYIVFWDQKHFYGSNILRSLVAKASTTLSADTLSDDNLQALWRLRELDKGQAIEYLFADDVASLIRAQIPDAKERPLTFLDIFCFVEVNQLKRQGLEAVESYLQKLDVLLQKLAMMLIVDEKVPLDDLNALWPQVRGAFFQTIFEGDARYFPLTIEQPKELFLQQNLAEVVQKLERLKENSVASRHLPLDAFIQLAKQLKVAYSTKIPDRVTAGPQKVNSGSYMFQQASQKSEEKMNQQMQMQQQLLDLEKTAAKPNVLWITPEKDFQLVDQAMYRKDFFRPQAINDVKAAAVEEVSQRQTLDEKTEVMIGRGVVFKGLAAPIVALADAIKENPQLHFLKGKIDPSLLATLNFMPLYQAVSDTEHRYLPYDASQHSLQNTLVVIDKETHSVKLLLLNGRDDEFFQYQLTKETKATSERETILLLLDQNGKVVQKSQECGFYQEVSPKVQKLLVQAKFLDGEISYSQEEIKLLRDWLKEMDVKQAKAAFESIFLFRKDRNRLQYPYSPLFALFEELST